MVELNERLNKCGVIMDHEEAGRKSAVWLFFFIGRWLAVEVAFGKPMRFFS